ncbi:hypothetical protein DZB54_19305 [Herbaspirillum sp. 3R-3a1]|nr:hypothetical protein DZB54_19305 [Herbaspirillum sp. 3R-3a1]
MGASRQAPPRRVCCKAAVAERTKKERMMNMQKWCWKVMVSVCGLMLGNVALAADGCIPDAGISTLVGTYDFDTTFDISALAPGSVIASVTATAKSTTDPNSSVFRFSCPTAPATPSTVAGGLLPGGGVITSSFGTFDTIQTRVAGVGIRVTGSSTTAFVSVYPGTRGIKAGTLFPTYTLTFIKTDSSTSGVDSLAGSITYAFGDNKMQAIRFTLSNTIKFIRGNVTTCIPTVVPGNAITLPKVSTSALAANGQKAGWTPFSIRLDSCKTSGVQSNGVNVRTFFDGPRVNATTGNLDVTGPANVQLQLSNGDGSVINLAGVKGSQNVATTQIRAGTATLPYAVSYFATGKAGAGTVSSTVNFTMEFP